MKDTQENSYRTSKRNLWRDRVEQFLLDRSSLGATADEALAAMSEAYGQLVTINSVAPRLTELIEAGQAYDTGERRATRFNRLAAVIRHIAFDDRHHDYTQPKLFGGNAA